MGGGVSHFTDHEKDPYNLIRFVEAQAETYDSALGEIAGGKKVSHWMWFIFPQILGLGTSATSRFYAIRNVDEARAYLSHVLLGKRLVECTTALLAVSVRTAYEIFGHPDDSKLKSSMTLFEKVAGSGSVFYLVLEKYFAGERDERTLQLIS